MLVALKPPVKFSKCFLSVKFRTKFEVVQKKHFCQSLRIILFHAKGALWVIRARFQGN